MPLSKINILIDKQDTNEIVRDQIAAILVVEIDRQKDLAKIVGKNSIDWDIDIYIERLRPFEAMSDEDGEEIGEKPLVNVSFDNDVFDTKGSDVIGNQKARGTFFLDCYSHKNSYIDESGIKQAGDELTSRESDRIARIIRNIVMSDVWSYLGLQGTVFKRYILRREKFIPSDREGRFFENIIATRLTLEVDYKEYSPQNEGVDLELLVNTCNIGSSGLIAC
jgi:hypothetical protein